MLARLLPTTLSKLSSSRTAITASSTLTSSIITPLTTFSSSSSSFSTISSTEQPNSDLFPMRYGLSNMNLTSVSPAVKQALSLRNASRSEAVQFQVSLAMTEFQVHSTDTGSTPVQVAVLTVRIDALRGHLAMHPKDKKCRRGLDGLVSSRRKLLKYLERKDFESYARTVKSLNLI